MNLAISASKQSEKLKEIKKDLKTLELLRKYYGTI